jgi:hypothetical protein
MLSNGKLAVAANHKQEKMILQIPKYQEIEIQLFSNFKRRLTYTQAFFFFIFYRKAINHFFKWMTFPSPDLKIVDGATLKLVDKINLCCPRFKIHCIGITDAK